MTDERTPRSIFVPRARNGDPIAGGAISKVDGIFGGLTIANGVVIENAAGGSGNDTLRGNSADNVLDGKAGDDTAVFSGNRGELHGSKSGRQDVVSGPDGTDTLSRSSMLKFADATSTQCAGGPHPPASWSLAGVRDLTGEGTSDVVWYDATTGKDRSVEDRERRMGGQRRCRPASTGLAAAGYWRSERRRHQRLLWHNPTTGNVDLWKLVNGQWAGSVDIGPHPLGYQVAGIADFDHDGTERVLWYNSIEWRDRDLEDRQRPLERHVDVGPHPTRLAACGHRRFRSRRHQRRRPGTIRRRATSTSGRS